MVFWLIEMSPVQVFHHCEQLMRIFVRDLHDSDEATYFEWIWQCCRTSASLDILLDNFVEFIQRMSTSERVHFVRSILSRLDSAALFLKKIEICHGAAYSNGDTALDYFCQAFGGDILYYVADALSERDHVSTSNLELWTRIGVTAMQNGAALLAASRHIARNFMCNCCTPLLHLLLGDTPYQGLENTFSISRILTALKLWIT
jgi:hypothetical protein